MRRCVIILSFILAIILVSGCNLAHETVVSASSPFGLYFQSPPNDLTVTEGTLVPILLVAQDSVGSGVTRVELSVDDILYQQGTPVEAEAVPVFTVEMNWEAQGAGLHALSAVAYRTDGSSSAPAVIRVYVLPQETLSP